MARKYTNIWLALKKNTTCAITAHVRLHPRIIKAVSCEKNRDVGFKLIAAERNKKVILTHKVDGSRIRFFITEYYLNPEAIPIEEFM